MNLEDHVGDIVRKARMMSGVSNAAGARAAGLSSAEFSELEETGQCAGTPNLIRLAELIQLNGPKLQEISEGWLPAAKDLHRWRELRVITTGAGGMTVNCFLVWDGATRDAALFDTGFDAAPVLEMITRAQLDLRHVFITHGHSDHVDELPAIRERFPKSALHMNAQHQHRNHANDRVQLGTLVIANRETPGHASDGVTYLITGWPGAAAGVAVVGDALFSGSMGRAATWDPARAKVREQILSLPDETLVCPGHGPLTTVREEKAHNPFF
jgi:glyoxylase-like metal-dependent hydrolase (beta-lactamase superfamily II)